MQQVIHPAFTYTYAELLEGLNQEIQKGYVIRRQHPTEDLQIYTYTFQCTIDNAWTEFSEIARGLVLCHSEQRIVALPFPKFFNYGERGYDIPEEEFVSTEKIDGSCGICFHFHNKWYVVTKGAFESEQAQWATEYLYKNIHLGQLRENMTYIFEIVYPENRIVISYPYTGLVLLGGYDNYTGEEYDLRDLRISLYSSHFLFPQIYTYSFSEMITLCKTMTSSQEGFVVRFENGLRMKIKGDEYCRVHRILSQVTPLGIWRSYCELDNIEEIRKQLPEEYLQDFDTICSIYDTQIGTDYLLLENTCNIYSKYSDKELGILLQSKENAFHPLVRKFIFACRKQNFLKEVLTKGTLRRKYFETFRPTGNILDGYIPSTILTRFQREKDV